MTFCQSSRLAPEHVTSMVFARAAGWSADPLGYLSNPRRPERARSHGFGVVR